MSNGLAAGVPVLDRLQHETVPEALRGAVLTFLKEQGLESVEELAAATQEDLSLAFARAPADFSLGHRAAVRRLCEAAQRRPKAAQDKPLLPWFRWTYWFGPAAFKARDTVREARRTTPALWVSPCTVLLAVLLGIIGRRIDTYSFLFEWDERCNNEPLEANNTGLKYIVTGPTIEGANMMSRALYDLGIEQSYQGEDLSMLVWSGLYDDYWQEQKGTRNQFHVQWRLGSATDWPLSTLGLPPSIQTLLYMRPEKLAAAVSRCRIEALSLAGMENLFWPLYHLSPNATIILVHRKPDEKDFDWTDEYINPDFAWMLATTTVLMSPPFMLPWQLLTRLLDPLLGNRIQRRLQSGSPPLSVSYDPFMAFWHHGLAMRRFTAHRYGGLHWRFSYLQGDQPYDRAYGKYLSQFWNRVPESRVKQWYGPSNNWDELCELVGVEPCPWSGNLPERTIVPDFKFDYMSAYWLRIPIHLLLLWLNCLCLKLAYNIMLFSLWLARPLRRRAKRVTDSLWRVLRVVLPPLALLILVHAVAAPIRDLRVLQSLVRGTVYER